MEGWKGGCEVVVTEHEPRWRSFFPGGDIDERILSWWEASRFSLDVGYDHIMK